MSLGRSGQRCCLASPRENVVLRPHFSISFFFSFILIFVPFLRVSTYEQTASEEMDDADPIFDRLDMLERDQQRQAYDHQHNSSAGYSVYDGFPQQCGYENAYPSDYGFQEDFAQEPLQLDAFGESPG